jgi:hypothetical protein
MNWRRVGWTIIWTLAALLVVTVLLVWLAHSSLK